MEETIWEIWVYTDGTIKMGFKEFMVLILNLFLMYLHQLNLHLSVCTKVCLYE
jgi:hypothetical protein